MTIAPHIQSATRAIEEFAAVAGPIFKELNRTVLVGWPFDESPTEAEAAAIESTAKALGMHEPALSESRRWYLAGQIVARLRRDRLTIP